MKIKRRVPSHGVIILGIMRNEGLNQRVSEELDDARIVVGVCQDCIHMGLIRNAETKVAQRPHQKPLGICRSKRFHAKRFAELTEETVITGRILCAAYIMKTSKHKLKPTIASTLKLNERKNFIIA